ncbi:MAG: hypothetical protein ACYC5M_16435 [Anaerolineae bacterium]
MAKHPVWAPRVPQQQIRRLYESDAQGLYDEELLDEVGYGLLARCQSFVDANEARAGRARCPECAGIVAHTWQPEEVLRCTCGWQLPWAEYFRTIQHVQLSGAEPVLAAFREFIEQFPRSATPQAKMLAIDCLIHRFHWFFKDNTPTRPAAVNLIEGRLNDVIALLDQLTYGPRSTPGVEENYAAWDRNIDIHAGWFQRRTRRTTASEERGTGRHDGD